MSTNASSKKSKNKFAKKFDFKSKIMQVMTKSPGNSKDGKLSLAAAGLASQASFKSSLECGHLKKGRRSVQTTVNKNLLKSDNYKDLTDILVKSGWYNPNLDVDSAQIMLANEQVGNFLILDVEEHHWKNQFLDFPGLRLVLDQKL